MSPRALQLRSGTMRVRGGEVRIDRTPRAVLRGWYRSLEDSDRPLWSLTKQFFGASAVTTLLTGIPTLWGVFEAAASDPTSVGAAVDGLGEGMVVLGTVVGAVVVLVTLAYRSLVDRTIPLSELERVDVEDGDPELTLVRDGESRLPWRGTDQTVRPVTDEAVAEAAAALERRGVRTRHV